jgi:hypothetical protein
MLVITIGVMALALPGAWSWVAEQQQAKLEPRLGAMVLETEPKSLGPEPKG